MKWTKASASTATGACVEVAHLGNTNSVFVRHSKQPDGPVLEYTREEWQAFLAGAKAGEFDLPQA